MPIIPNVWKLWYLYNYLNEIQISERFLNVFKILHDYINDTHMVVYFPVKNI